MAKRHKPDMDGEDMASPMFGGKRGGKRKKGRKGKRSKGRY